MLNSLTHLGTAGCIGLMLGLFLVWWVQPLTDGGTGLLILICVALSTIVGGILSWALAQRASGTAKPRKARRSAPSVKRHKRIAPE
jgi:uncharacterized membrane protein YccC